MSDPAWPDADAAIIGAGIIGVCAAAFLAEAGLKVNVFDRTGICEETSSGNAGAFAFSDVLPLAHKGMARNLPKWLLDPLGPLAIAPSYLPKLLPWLIRFWRAGSGRSYESSLAAQAGLMRLAEAEWDGLMRRSDSRGLLREAGSLELYESEAEFEASLPGWRARQRFGIAHLHLDREELLGHQPGLSPRIVCGTFVPGWKTVADPQRLGQAVWRYAETRGARFVHGDAAMAMPSRNGIAVQLREGRTHLSRNLVVAAGAWSKRLARQFGDRIPLETERGYNTTLPKSAFDVRRMLVFPEHGFVITPLADALRIGGAVELAGWRIPRTSGGPGDAREGAGFRAPRSIPRP